MPSIDEWLTSTYTDDYRRYSMLVDLLPGKNLLDFGCGNGGFLSLSAALAKSIKGVELETRVINYWENKITITPTE